MTLPLLWRQKYKDNAVLELSRAAFVHPFLNAGLSGPESLVVALNSNPPIIDDSAAIRWQTNMVAAYRQGNNFASPETVQSTTITFRCFNRDDAPVHGGCIVCRSAIPDWEVIFGVGDGGAGPVAEQLQEARAILKSIQ